MTDWLTKKAEAEREWFRLEHERQFGKPPTTEQDVALNKVVAKLEKLSKKKVCERKHFFPKVKLPPPLVHIEWNAPLALHCACPTGDCSCTCKGNTLLPRKRLPIIPPYNWWGVRPVLCKLHIVKRPKPAGDLAREFAEAVKKDSEFYKSKQGRDILTERGPEFCLSGCLKFYITNKKIQKDFVKVIREMKAKDVTSEAPGEVQEEKVVPEKELSERICDQFRCTVSTQSQVDDEGEFIIGAYSHLLFGMPEEEFLCDIEGAELNVASYKRPVCASRESLFLGVVKTADKLFHVTHIKQRISQVKKDLITSIFEIRERRHSKGSQYEYKDLPVEVSEGVCESLAGVRRKRREKECLKKNKVPVEEEVQTQDAKCYCKFRYKQVLPKSLDTDKRLKEDNGIFQGDTPVKATTITPPTARPLPSRSNLKLIEDKPCPSCVIHSRSKLRVNKSLSDADKRVIIDLSQTGKGSEDKIEVGKQTSFIGSLKVSYDDRSKFENEKMRTAMPEDGQNIGARFSKEVATDIVPEFYGSFDDGFNIIRQKSNTMVMDNIVESFKDQDNETSIELFNKVMKDASILIQPEKNVVHKSISTVRSVELIMLRPDAKCAKGNFVKNTSNMRDPSCTPCFQDRMTDSIAENENNVVHDSEKTQPHRALKPTNNGNLKENFDISYERKEGNFRKSNESSLGLQGKSEIGTENIETMLKEVKTTYKDGTCQPCDKLLKIAKYIHKALSEPSDHVESKDLQAIRDVHDKTNGTEKNISGKFKKDNLSTEEKVKGIEAKEHPLAAASRDAIESIGNIIKKELYKTDNLKSSSKEHKVGSLVEKNSSTDRQPQVTGMGKEFSEVDELRDYSIEGSKLNSQLQKQGSKGMLPKLAGMETESPKTRGLKIESPTNSKFDVQIRRPSSEIKVPGLAEVEKHVSQIDELYGMSKMKSKDDSKTDKLNSKGRFSVSIQEKQQEPKIDELKVESIINSKNDVQKAVRKEKLPGVKKKLSKTGELTEISSIKSVIDSQVQELDSKGKISAEEGKQDFKAADKLKVGSNIDPQIFKPNIKNEPTDSIEVKKELSRDKDLKETSSLETKIDSHAQKLGSKGKTSKATKVKELVSKIDELEDDASTGSLIDIQSHKPSSIERSSELIKEKKELSKSEELKKTTSIESHHQKRETKDSVPKAVNVKDVSKFDEFEDDLSSAFINDTQSRRPSSTEAVSKLSNKDKAVSKTEYFKETFIVESKTDILDQEQSSKSRISEAVHVKERASKIDDIKDTSSTAFNIRRPSSKNGLPESIVVKKEISESVDLKVASSTESKTNSLTGKLDSNAKHSETVRVAREVSEANKLKHISSSKSEIDFKSYKINGKEGRLQLQDVKKEFSKELKQVSSIESKIRTQAPKSDIDERLSDLTKVIKEVSKSDEFKETSISLYKISSKTRNPSGMGRFSEISELKSSSKTAFNHGSTHSDITKLKPENKGWFSKLKKSIKEKSKPKQLKDTSSFMRHSDSQAQKPSSKERFTKVRKKVSKTDEVLVSSSIMCCSDSETLPKLLDREKDKSSIKDLKKTPSIESHVDTHIQKPNSKSILSELVDGKKTKSKTDNLKVISSIKAKLDTHIELPDSKDRISKLIDSEKKLYETDYLKDSSSTDSKVDTYIEESGSESKVSEFADTKNKKSNSDALEDISSIESKVDTQSKKSGSKDGTSEYADIKKEKFEADVLQEISSIESKEDPKIKKPSNMDILSKLANRKKEKAKTEKIRDNADSNVDSHSQIHLVKEGSLGITELAKEVSKSKKMIEASSIVSERPSETQKLTTKDNSTESIKVKKQISKINKLGKIPKAEPNVNINSKEIRSKEDLQKLRETKTEVSEADELKELYSIESNKDAKNQKSNSKQILPHLREVKNEVSKTEQLKEYAGTELYISSQNQTPGSKAGPSKLTGVKKEASINDELKEVISSKTGTKIEKDVTKLPVLKAEQTKTDELRKISSIESKADTQKTAINKAPQVKQKPEPPDVTGEIDISKGKTSTTQPQKWDTKSASKETKQDLPQVAGHCPVKKLTNLKNTIKRYLVPEDIPKVCKDVACQPCHKLKDLEKIVHKAFLDIEHSDMRVNKQNTDKESEAKKKTDIVMSQLSIEGNSGRINVLNQNLSTEFSDALPGAPKLEETNKILESYIINSDHKLVVNRREVKKTDLRIDNGNISIQSNKKSVLREFYLSLLHKLQPLKDLIKRDVIPTRSKRYVNSSPWSLGPGQVKQDVDSVISPLRIENIRGKIKAMMKSLHNKPKDIQKDVHINKRNVIKDNTIFNGKAIPCKTVPILKLGPPHIIIKSSEKTRQNVSFKNNLEYICKECKHCKSCVKYCSKSHKEILSKSDYFDKNLEAYITRETQCSVNLETWYKKINSQSI